MTQAQSFRQRTYCGIRFVPDDLPSHESECQCSHEFADRRLLEYLSIIAYGEYCLAPFRRKTGLQPLQEFLSE